MNEDQIPTHGTKDNSGGRHDEFLEDRRREPSRRAQGRDRNRGRGPGDAMGHAPARPTRTRRHAARGHRNGGSTDALDPGSWEAEFMIFQAHTRNNFLTEIAADGSLVPELADRLGGDAGRDGLDLQHP
jgi:hypothetical protein